MICPWCAAEMTPATCDRPDCPVKHYRCTCTKVLFDVSPDGDVVCPARSPKDEACPHETVDFVVDTAGARATCVDCGADVPVPT